ncbi:hypothetical protein KIPB_008126 [Kipferlia bialata]|uniref:Peptidase S9 prolyl oligopeptidase catalytic domain-containing protein n=1 Tax=Kipferlia bialata TaxID=797122 RepID=A0A9K3D2Y4_9EUKA|nr:hypothetical protein KIPB_008126 [Kipferlia bialata]|eukprot:g8126.t1
MGGDSNPLFPLDVATPLPSDVPSSLFPSVTPTASERERERGGGGGKVLSIQTDDYLQGRDEMDEFDVEEGPSRVGVSVPATPLATAKTAALDMVDKVQGTLTTTNRRWATWNLPPAQICRIALVTICVDVVTAVFLIIPSPPGTFLNRASLAAHLVLFCLYLTPFAVALCRPHNDLQGGFLARLLCVAYFLVAPTAAFSANLSRLIWNNRVNLFMSGMSVRYSRYLFAGVAMYPVPALIASYIAHSKGMGLRMGRRRVRRRRSHLPLTSVPGELASPVSMKREMEWEEEGRGETMPLRGKSRREIRKEIKGGLFVTIWTWLQLFACMELCVRPHLFGFIPLTSAVEPFVMVFFAMASAPIAARMVYIRSWTAPLAVVSVFICMAAWSNDITAVTGHNGDFSTLPQLDGVDVVFRDTFSFNSRMFGYRMPKDSGVTVQEDLVWYAGPSREDDSVELVMKVDVYSPNPSNINGAVVVNIHGGGFVLGSKGRANVPRNSARLAEAGYTVFDTNYGLLDIEDNPLHRIPEMYLWRDLVSYKHIDSCGADIEDFIDWLEREIENLDLGIEQGFPLFVRGISAGSGLSMFLSERHSDRVSGAILESLCDDVLDPGQYGEQDEWYYPLLRAVPYVHAGMPPVLQFHGGRDNLCHKETSVDAVGAALRDQGVDWGYIVAPMNAHTCTADNTLYSQLFSHQAVQFLDAIMATL